MSHTTHGAVKLRVVILTVVALIVALIGYDLIHKAEAAELEEAAWRH